ncbi:MAG: copper resistance protein B [Emcibacteraceae bacterium]|nr:copper resistance protein B [Emcibacteraceae bacterium]
MKNILLTPFICSALLLNYAQAQEPLDEFYTQAEMAKSRALLKKITGAQNHMFIMADKFEYRSAEEGALAWEVQGWYGGDKEKVRFK